MSNETTPETETTPTTTQPIEALDKLAEALAKAQKVFTVPTKSKTAKIKGEKKDGGSFEYSYKYSDLDDLIKATRDGLADNGLSILQPTVQVKGAVGVRTVILHSSGQRWSSEPLLMPLPERVKPQDIGIAITYARRYSMGAALNVTAEDDLDANMQDQERSTGNQQRRVRLPDEQQNAPQTQQSTKSAAKPSDENKSAPASTQTAATASNATVEYVNKAKVKRMFGIAQVHSVSVAALKAYLAAKKPPIMSSDHIPVTEFDDIVKDIQNGKVPEVKP
jgi:negative regulator of genetic competence, sporulation and motility